jgi:energy-coupling factor transport system permease protein
MNSDSTNEDRGSWFPSASFQPNDETAQGTTGHIGAWLLWLAAAALPALTTRNPAYLLLLLLAMAIVQMALPRTTPQSTGWSFFLKAGLFLWLFTIPLNALTVHHGETVLFSLPRDMPLIGRIVGGPITLEAISFGFLTGLGLLAVLLVFVTFNRAIDPYQLMRAVPAVFFQTGVVTSIALSFVPQATVALREIREAQAIRGHRWRGLRDLVPLALPLLTTALERALQLAESMESRGFGMARVRNPTLRRWAQRMLLLGLLVMLGGLILRGFYVQGLLGSGILFVGGASVVAALILQNQSVVRSRYRRRPWTIQDKLQALLCGLGALAYLVVLILRSDLLSFYPYPQLHWPDFQPALGLLFLVLTVPAWLILWRRL